MSQFRVGAKPPSLWSRTGPTLRLVVGAVLIAAIGLLGLTEKTLFGVTVPWPHAALWGAVGWGMVGLSLRPMLALTLLGFAQDIAFVAPLGCFVLVNLSIYGLSAAVSDAIDPETDPFLSWLAPIALTAAGFLGLWIIASSVADHAVQAWPLLLAYFSTVGLYFFVGGIFRLGRAPGEPAGQGV